MAGDFSRSTFNRVKHYAGVLMQQGRVQVDADWNEQLALQLYRTWTETRDVIGCCGTPKCGDGFAISSFDNGADLLIHPGHYYVNGLLCDLDPQVVLAWLPSSTSPPKAAAPVYRMSPGQSLSGLMREIEMNRAQSDAFNLPVQAVERVVYIPSLTLDDRDLAAGDWVEISGTTGASVTAMVKMTGAAVAPDNPNFIVPSYVPVTVDKTLKSLENAGQLSLRRVVTFTTQPFLTNQWDESVESSPLSGPSGLVLPNGDYLVVLEAWQREIDALEDPHIREVALGGPDTCERLQTVWQVHVLPWSGESSPLGSPLHSPLPSPPSPLDCCSDFPTFDNFQAATRTTGLMNAQAPPAGPSPSCQLPPSAGYLGLANQLYRVEIFQSGHHNDAATFVWSRDNAMVEAPIVCVDGEGNVYVTSLGTDDLHSFDLNDWVEIVDDDADLQGQPRFLAQITNQSSSAAQALCAAPGVQAYSLTLLPPAPARFQNKTNLRLRRWDMPDTGMYTDASGNPIGIKIVPGWTVLENNIQVNFTDGFYATRSYWQIPARTATGDIEWPPFDVPNSNPIPQPPLGPDHYFCRLAMLTVTDGHIKVADCRCTFPSLNSICADIQQAADERDALHRLQNRTLHGSGVVCGLAVTCPGANSSPTSVNVAQGYAIDCDGYDLVLNSATNVDLASLVDLSPQQGVASDGEYELILERAANTAGICRESTPSSPPCDPCCSDTGSAVNPFGPPLRFRAIPCEEESLSDQILNGTLLMDFYDSCLSPIVSGFKSQYTNTYLTPDDQVTTGQALLSALVDLVIQYFQPTLTKDVYISADEATRLQTFYNFIAGLLGSDCCYCSLLTNLRPFPEYTLDAPITTIYGKGYKTCFRMSPSGNLAVSCGSGPDLHMYDLTTGALAADITPPIPGTASGWTLQDVAFSVDGTQIFIIATGTNTQTNAFDSFFAMGNIAGNTITWTTQGSAGPQSYLTLAFSSQQPETVYAVAQGAGLYTISFANNTVTAAQVASFDAIGHLVYNGGNLYATATAANANAGAPVYEVLSFALMAAGAAAEQPNGTFQLNGQTIDLTDDLAVGTYIQVDGAITATILVSGLSSATSTKQIAIFPVIYNNKQFGQVDLGINTTVRMALQPAGSQLFVSLESTSQLVSVAPNPNEVSAVVTYAPVELNPTSIAFGVSENAAPLYTLNSTANTISAIQAGMPAFTSYSTLEEYRVQALDAFIDLAGAFLQYLKDCFCKLLLPSCPTCNEDDREGDGVALCCITIQNGVVQSICNLEKRKIVKSFPTVGYWLSLIPIIPVVKVLIEKFCCLALRSRFSKMEVADPTKENQVSGFTTFNKVSGENVRYALAQAHKINFSSVPTNLLLKSMPIGQLTLDSIVSPFRQPSAAVQSASIARVNGMTLDQAKAALQAANVQVAATETYNPATFAQNVGSYVSAPASVPAGSSVTLVVDSSNTVRYYIPTAPAVQQLGNAVQANQTATQKLQTQVAAVETAEPPALQNIQTLQTLVTGLQTQIVNMQTAQASELATRDQQIAQLNTTIQQMQTKVGTIDTLTTQVQEIEGRLPPAAKS